MAASRPELQALIAANAPLWAGEAEVFRTYWTWEHRTNETDLAWIARQAHKELIDGVLPRLDEIRQHVEAVDADVPAGELGALLREAEEELAHYSVFVRLHAALRAPGGETLTVAGLRGRWSWAENAELASLRAAHRRQHGWVGARAGAITEGGRATLFVEGMRLGGRGDVDQLIADACAEVYEDELSHMSDAITGLDEAELSTAEWRLLSDLTCAQLRQRIVMRNAQFGYPVATARVRELQAGAAGAMPFEQLPRSARRPP